MIRDLGTICYEECHALQRSLVDKRRLGVIGDTVILAEHPAVFTVGRSGTRSNLLVGEDYLNGMGVRVIDVDRGGDITFHGPGQLVVYPIVDLKSRRKDLHRYLRDLEELCINFLKSYGVEGRRIAGRTGVWVDNKKIAFIGIGSRGWVTFHGLSININTDIEYFSMIRPCGMRDVEVTSLSKIIGRPVDMGSAKEVISGQISRQFAKLTRRHEYVSAMA